MKALIVILLMLVVGPAATAQTSIFLVRHAERADDSADSALSAAGKIRAAALAQTLRGQVFQFDHIFSTNTRRTRDTAAPTATDYRLPVTLYDPRDLPGFARQLQAMDGTILVVGHSNTTPELAELLGAQPGLIQMAHNTYDLLIRLDMRDGTRPKLVIQHYGAPSPE